MEISLLKPRNPFHLPVLAAYLLLSLVMTWPLAARLATHLPMGDNDLLQNYWNFWWWKKAIFELHRSPYATDLLYHPEGAGLGLHTHSEANQIWTLPINLAAGSAAALNTALLAGFVLAGFGAYLLARQYVAGPGPAFIAGILYAFTPNHVEQSLEHLNLASLYGHPLMLWGVIRLARGDPRGWLHAGALFALNTLLGRHNTLLVIPLAVAILIWEARSSGIGVRKLASALLKAACLAAVILAPFLWPAIHDAAAQVGYFRKSVAPRGIDPLFLLVPHPGHPVWGALFGGAYEKLRAYPNVGFVAYLGFTTLLLAGATLVPRGTSRAREGSDRGRLFWWASALLYLLLSLGATLTVAGRSLPSVPMPFDWLKAIPFIGMVRVPNRFLIPAVLCLSILAAMGAARIAGAARPARRRALLVLLGSVLALELLWLPYPMREIRSPDWVAALDGLPPDLAVLDLPGGHRARGADDMFLQTLHGRPIAGGYVSTPIRHVSRRLREFPVLRRVLQPRESDTGFEGPGLIQAIRALEVGIVVVHLDRSAEALRGRRLEIEAEHPGDFYRLRPFNPSQGMPVALLDRFRSELREAFGEPVHETPGEVEIFLVRPGPAPADTGG